MFTKPLTLLRLAIYDFGFMSTLKCVVKTELDTLNLFDPLNLIFNVNTFGFCSADFLESIVGTEL